MLGCWNLIFNMSSPLKPFLGRISHTLSAIHTVNEIKIIGFILTLSETIPSISPTTLNTLTEINSMTFWILHFMLIELKQDTWLRSWSARFLWQGLFFCMVVALKLLQYLYAGSHQFLLNLIINYNCEVWLWWQAEYKMIKKVCFKMLEIWWNE